MNNDTLLRASHVLSASLAKYLDRALAPLVAEGGELTRQSIAPAGIDRYYVNGQLRLEVGPPKLLCLGNRINFYQSFKTFNSHERPDRSHGGSHGGGR